MPDPAEIRTRTDGPIHGYFGLSYSNYLVLHRTLMQSMPVDWQTRAVALFAELDAAYAHIEHAECYDVRPAKDMYFNELTEHEIKRLEISLVLAADDEDGFTETFIDRGGEAFQGHDHVLVPVEGGDPVPDYNRGRTFVAPQGGE